MLSNDALSFLRIEEIGLGYFNDTFRLVRYPISTKIFQRVFIENETFLDVISSPYCLTKIEF